MPPAEPRLRANGATRSLMLLALRLGRKRISATSSRRGRLGLRKRISSTRGRLAAARRAKRIILRRLPRFFLGLLGQRGGRLLVRLDLEMNHRPWQTRLVEALQ